MQPPAMDFPTSRPETAKAFRHPLDLIRMEHERQVCLCDRLDRFADDSLAPGAPAPILSVLTYLTEDLVWHTEDEEQDLFPLLRARCLPTDGIEKVLDQLSREHALDQDLAEFLIGDLKTWANTPAQSPPVRFFINARGFAETQRRHLGWENRLVLPLARARLSPDDLDALGRTMAARRGIAYPD